MYITIVSIHHPFTLSFHPFHPLSFFYNVRKRGSGHPIFPDGEPTLEHIHFPSFLSSYHYRTTFHKSAHLYATIGPHPS